MLRRAVHPTPATASPHNTPAVLRPHAHRLVRHEPLSCSGPMKLHLVSARSTSLIRHSRCRRMKLHLSASLVAARSGSYASRRQLAAEYWQSPRTVADAMAQLLHCITPVSTTEPACLRHSCLLLNMTNCLPMLRNKHQSSCASRIMHLLSLGQGCARRPLQCHTCRLSCRVMEM